MTSDPITFPMDGPHSPESVMRAAEAVAEGIRYLNHATRAGQDGLEYPSDAGRLLGHLGTAAGRMPQLCGQVAAWLAAQARAGALEDDQGRHPAMVAEHAGMSLEVAAARAADLGRAIGRARSLADSLSVSEGGSGE